MEFNAEKLADRVIESCYKSIECSRHFIVLVGAPGSGKSTIAGQVSKAINQRFQKFLDTNRDSFVQEPESVRFQSAVEAIPEITPPELNNVESFMYVESESFVPKLLKTAGQAIVISRGGLPTSLRISHEKEVHPSSEPCQILPMDGFHLPLKCLHEFDDPEAAVFRRGAPHTFDNNNLIQLTKLLAATVQKKKSNNLEGQTQPDPDFATKQESVFRTWLSATPEKIFLPNFDHALKDPTRDGICISGTTKLIIMEGLYLLLDQGEWPQIYRSLPHECTEVWKITPNPEFRERVAKRHVASGIAQTIEEGLHRYDGNDAKNGKLIENTMLHVSSLEITN